MYAAEWEAPDLLMLESRRYKEPLAFPLPIRLLLRLLLELLRRENAID